MIACQTCQFQQRKVIINGAAIGIPVILTLICDDTPSLIG
jgi:hypothetical protein